MDSSGRSISFTSAALCPREKLLCPREKYLPSNVNLAHLRGVGRALRFNAGVKFAPNYLPNYLGEWNDLEDS